MIEVLLQILYLTKVSDNSSQKMNEKCKYFQPLFWFQTPFYLRRSMLTMGFQRAPTVNAIINIFNEKAYFKIYFSFHILLTRNDWKTLLTSSLSSFFMIIILSGFDFSNRTLKDVWYKTFFFRLRWKLDVKLIFNNWCKIFF